MEAEAALVVAFACEVIVDARWDGCGLLCVALGKSRAVVGQPRCCPPPDIYKEVAPKVAQSSDAEAQQHDRRHDHGGELHLVDRRWRWTCSGCALPIYGSNSPGRCVGRNECLTADQLFLFPNIETES